MPSSPMLRSACLVCVLLLPAANGTCFPGFSDACCTAMQEAIHGAVFLAGEACHEGVNPCIHGAMETGEKAAERAAAVIASQGGAWSKL